MEDNQIGQNETPVETPAFQENTPSNVSFPTVGAPRKSGGAKTLLIVGILVLVAILGFVIYKSASKKSDTTVVEPTPFDNLTVPSQDNTQTTSTVAPVASPTSTPKAADKTTVSILVQNGTGITGEGAYLQTQLKNLGYTNVKTGNASAQTATGTQVTFSSALSTSIVTEITQELNSIYQNVTATTSKSAATDVVVITGLRKGATAKPSVSPTASASASATPKATATP